MTRRFALPFIFVLVLSISSLVVNDEFEEDEYEDVDEEIEERAFLVVQKKVLENEIPDGSNVTVVLTLHNAGTRAASDIEIKDQTLPQSVAVAVESFDTIKINQLSPGLSESFKITIRPSSAGQLMLGPAKVLYTPISGSKERQIVWSTSSSVLVLTTNEYLVSKILLMGSYVTFGVLKTQIEWIRFGVVAGVLFLVFGMKYLAKKLSVARQDRVRQKAIEALEKEK